ncbi:hypothetical protein ASE86_05385 [Sphingomonas sp. Leaf33]|uniref:ArnT family glycosyltransferase n=1 Tax=Sphingomonas sp. Leaf33 TaxID=1736215 RepID=UPI0006FB60DC|nr:hypothetical protein [Sphingomonas sp. Leaf33]KQN25644.1 hypothetical protein ASE86_05385 [Sphingomonas sp. Leaf33]
MPHTRTLPAWAAALLLLVVAVALRAADFGNPIIHVDEQYYLLIGQRMLEGAVPYIDIWDRKPVGLFLLYAGAAALPGDDVLGYQLLATLFAGLTACVVASGARALGASRSGAVAAGLAYLIWLPLLGGRGGQAPVFYNLFVALAARLTLRLPGLAERRSIGAIVVNGALACLAAGVAIQVKTTAVFEAAFIGLAHVWWLARVRPAAVFPGALLWLAIGVAPTLAVVLAYRAMGPAALDAWWFANAQSIFLRPGYPIGEIAMRLLGIVAQLSPLLLCAAIGWRRRMVRMTGERALAFAWLAAAAVGFGAIGTFFDHYALPLLPPLTMIAGIALGRIPRVLVGTLLLGVLLLVVERAFIADDAAGARQVANVVARNSRGGCPYVFMGDTATYTLSRTCLPTAHAFPNFLAYTTEAGASGIAEAAEMRRILAARPPVIVASTRRLAIWNPATVPLLQRALRDDYRQVLSVPRSSYRTVVFLRRDLAVIR